MTQPSTPKQFQTEEIPLALYSQTELLKHEFRALTGPLVKKKKAKPKAEAEDADEPGGDPDSADRNAKGEWSPPDWFGYRKAYNLLLRMLYWTFGRVRPPRRRKTSGPIRVLRVASFISTGGVAKVCVQSTLHTPSDRVQYTLLAFREKGVTMHSLEQRPDITVISRKMQLWPSGFSPRFFRHVFKLSRFIRKSKAEIIHIHEPQFAPVAAIAAGMAGGCHVVVHLHNDYNVRRTSITRGQNSVHQHALTNAHLIACSKTIHDAAYGWLDKPRWPVELILDGTDDQPDQPPDERLAADLRAAAAGRTVIAMMAHLVPHKRIEDFVQAGRILIDMGYPVFMLLMGYGKLGAAVRIRNAFDQILEPSMGQFLFQVDAPQHLMDQIGIGVTTSSLEGLGLNVLEYQVEGVPVVCSDLLPHREMVTDDENGLMFQVGDVSGCVRQIKRLLDDKQLALRLGEAGRTTAKQRTWNDTGRHTAEFYEKIMSR